MKTKHPFWQNSMCIGQYLHRFSIVEEYPAGVMEVCEICHARQFFKIIDDKVDNAEYMSYHLRQSLPPNHGHYYHEHEYDAYSNKIESPYV